MKTPAGTGRRVRSKRRARIRVGGRAGLGASAAALLLLVPGARADDPGCPGDLEGWTDFRDRVAGEVVAAARAWYADGGDAAARRFQDLAVARDRELGECLADSAPLREQGLGRCTARLRWFLRNNAIAAEPGRGLGFNRSDASYLSETQRYTEIPGFLTDPRFLTWVSDRETLPQAKRYLEQWNAGRPEAERSVFFSFRSRHLGTPDDPESFGRLLVVVPGRPEVWVRFEVPEGGGAVSLTAEAVPYLREPQRAVAVPEFLRDPELRASIADPKTRPRARRRLEALNAGRPASEPLAVSPLDPAGLLVVVPGRPERWVGFGVPEPGRRVRNISVVAVAGRPDGTSDVYFMDRYRTFHEDGSITIHAKTEEEALDRCVTCHKSGVLPIFPAEGSVPLAELPRVEQVNRRLRQYLPPRFGGYYDPSRSDPGLGFVDPARSDEEIAERLRECSAGHELPDPARSRERIRAAMICGECHHVRYLGALDFPWSAIVTHSFVSGGRMPPGNDLVPAEREALYDCLESDYFSTVLPGWLGAYRCSEAPGPLPPIPEAARP